uniref:Ubiquitin carboxyl-terminal hydrolase n=1 Tax=Hydra vulgaris TaxID=6087 RepID=T2M9G1_HYDVU|nr:ubiquitin carboxyl-terminal hydrolase 35 [Hydra vulgaris]
MDKILLGILNSPYPDKLKIELIQKISYSAEKNIDNKPIDNILQICVDFFKEDNYSNELNSAMDNMFMNWVKHNKDASLRFLTDEVLKKPLNQMESNIKIKHVRSINKCINTINAIHDISTSPIKTVLSTYLYSFFFKVDELELLACFCGLYLQYPVLFPSNLNFSVLSDLSTRMVSIISSSQFVFITSKDYPTYYNHLNHIYEFFLKHFGQDEVLKKQIAITIFNTLTNPNKCPSISLAKLVPCFQLEVLSKDLEVIILSSNISDETLIFMLSQMVDWACFPTDDFYIERLINNFIGLLIRFQKSNVLFVVIENKINQLCNLILFPSTRKTSLGVLTFSLMSYLHSPTPFHQACKFFPKLIDHLQKEESCKKYDKILAELIFTLMYHFPGYPDVYSDILVALKNYKKPSESEMKLWLSASSVLVKVEVPHCSIVSRKSETGKVGLENLGNTCFMNSIIQALFNLINFRNDIISHVFSPSTQNVSVELQKIFSLLSFSERPAIVPKSFYDASRPEWFCVGSQQDCSEYFKYVLDRLEKDKPSLVQHFTGMLNVIVECLNCHVQSIRKELFNDLPLSFHENVAGQYTLKGGNPTGNQSRSMQCDRGESSIILEQVENDDTLSDKEVSDDESLLSMLCAYFLPEHLSEMNSYFCNNCQSLQDATKRINIVSFPPYLTLTLKRFMFNVKTQKRSKLLQQIDYPLTFKLCKGCSACCDNTKISSQNPSIIANSLENCQSEIKYRLSSVIVHSGLSLDCGHYYSYTCQYSANGYTWLLMNDSRISKVSMENFSKSGKSFPRDTPYICIYEKYDIDLFATAKDVLLPQYLRDMVDQDNAIYREEIRMEELKQKRVFPKNTFNKDKDDDDDDFNCSTSCSSSSSNWDSGKYIF